MSKLLAVYICVMNSRPKSEDPVELIAEHTHYFSENGYRWVRGESGIKKAIPGLFLVPNPGKNRSLILPEDFYVELAQLEISEESTLAFAAKFGSLGLPRRHFHSTESTAVMGESAGDWGNSIGQFQFAFRVWSAAEDGDSKTIKELLAQEIAEEGPKVESLKAWIAKDPIKCARLRVVEDINLHLAAWTQIGNPIRRGCFRKSCWFKKSSLPTPPPQYVQYQLREIGGKGKVKGHLSSSSRLVSAWLQFAELVCGKRTLRPCNVCHQLMDVSQSARPGAKRMHDRCSLAGRMRRYRSKGREENVETKAR